MNRDPAVRGAHAARVRASGPLSRTFLRKGAFFRLDSSRSSFRRAAETSTRAACAPQIAAEPPVNI